MRTKNKMLEVNVCSLGVQLEILQCEEVLTALFVIETQLEWVSSSSLIMRPFPLSLGLSLQSLPVLSVAVALLALSLPTSLQCAANSWRRRDKGGVGIDRALDG